MGAEWHRHLLPGAKRQMVANPGSASQRLPALSFLQSTSTRSVSGSEITLFDARVGEDHAQVWLKVHGGGLTLRTQEWGSGIERNFGFDTIETWLTIDESAMLRLASAVQEEGTAAGEGLSPVEVIRMWLAGDSAASAHLRMRLESLGLRYEFVMR